MRTYSFVSYEVYTEWRNCFFVNRSTVHTPYFALVVVTDFKGDKTKRIKVE